MTSFDYIIVGAGSSGCVLANRLTADPACTVLLLEAGPRDDHWSIDMPSAMGLVVGGKRFNWGYHSEPEPCLDNRRIYTPRGRVLGGSSSINGMVYIRGHARDYDAWAEAGNEGWSYAEVLPYFRRAESHELGADAYHGGDGPLHVKAGDTGGDLPQAFVEAGAAAGYGRSDDLNGFRQEGFGRVDRTTRHGKRWSTARGYLAAASDRPNLTVKTGAMARRVLFDGARATGIEFASNEQVERAHARTEVVLCGGAINSPHLLMLSGIGDPAALSAVGITPRHALPGVGQRLSDHPDIVVQYHCKAPVSIYPWTMAPRKWAVGAQWFLTRSGIAATNHFEAGAFIRSRPGVRHPDLQLTFMPLAVIPGTVDVFESHAFQIHIDLMRPESLGAVSLQSADPAIPPKILFNYLQAAQDRADMRAGVRLVRDIVDQRPFSALAGDEISPGPGLTDDAALDAFIRRFTETGYHAAGTCKMGPATDREAVVGPDLKVHGLEAIRVIDASIMPSIVSGNTNAPSIMIGEKGSDNVMGKTPLPRSTAPVWMHADWQTRQR